jgi:hypothetical protein
MSNYLEGALIGHIFQATAYSMPSVLAIALCTSATVASDTGATLRSLNKEVPVSFGYARQTLNPSGSNWTGPVSGNGTVSNNAQITFGPASGGAWQNGANTQITYVAILDSSTDAAGNILFQGALTTPKTVNDGDTLRFNVGDLSVQLS